MNQKQQSELDKIESKILILLFGSVAIPEKTSIALKMANVNPNEYIQMFENFMQPILKEDGQVDGIMLKKLIQFTKYKDVVNLFAIPDTDFFLSEIIENIITSIFPGVNKNAISNF